MNVSDGDTRVRFPREYAAWEDMIARCYDPTHPEYPNEGGRGIQVCERWRDSFDNFLTDMGPMPE